MGENDEKVLCQVCGTPIEGQVIYCRNCKTPHHADCWDYVGHCSTFACGCEASTSDRSKELAADGLRIDEQGVAWQGRRRVSLKTASGRGKFIRGLDGSNIPINSEKSDLDLDTPLESYLQLTSLFAVLATFALADILGKTIGGFFIELVWPLAFILMLIRVSIKCSYVLDNENEKLLYFRSCLGFVWEWEICDFDEIEEVRVLKFHVSRANPFDLIYHVTLLLSDLRVQVSESTRSEALAIGFAQQLAEHLGCRFHIEEVESFNLFKELDSNYLPLFPSQILWSSSALLGRTKPGWLLWFICTFFFALLSLTY